MSYIVSADVTFLTFLTFSISAPVLGLIIVHDQAGVNDAGDPAKQS